MSISDHEMIMSEEDTIKYYDDLYTHRVARIPIYRSPEVIIEQLHDVIYEMAKEIDELKKENIRILNNQIKHNNIMMGNILEMALRKGSTSKG